LYEVSFDTYLPYVQLLQPLSAPIDEVMRDLCYSGQINCSEEERGEPQRFRFLCQNIGDTATQSSPVT